MMTECSLPNGNHLHGNKGCAEAVADQVNDGLEKHFINVAVSNLCRSLESALSSSSSSSGETEDDENYIQTTLVQQYRRKGRLFNVYNIGRTKSDCSSDDSYCKILELDQCQKYDLNSQPTKRRKLRALSRNNKEIQQKKDSNVSKSGNVDGSTQGKLDIFEVERRMINDRLFHRYFVYKTRRTPVWLPFEPLMEEAHTVDPRGKLQKVISFADSLKVLRGSNDNISSMSRISEKRGDQSRSSSVHELKKMFEDFQTANSNGKGKTEKNDIEDMLKRAATEFTGNFDDIDPELIKEGKKYLESKGMTLEDVAKLVKWQKFSLKNIVSQIKIPIADLKIAKLNLPTAAKALAASFLLAIFVYALSALINGKDGDFWTMLREGKAALLN